MKPAETNRSVSRGPFKFWTSLRFWLVGAAILIVVVPYLIPGPTPPAAGFSVRTEPFPGPPGRIHLLIDTTRHEPVTERRILDQEIFDQMLEQIARADDFIVADFFLWNPWKAADGAKTRRLSLELASALISRKLETPGMPIVVLTDPINRIYDADEPEIFTLMAEAGIPVVFTDLDRLRDSNRIYAAPARFYGPVISALLSPTGLLDRRVLDNPFDPALPDISLRQLGRMLFFKANHRKVLISRSDALGIELLSGSLNPAEGSANHSNLALQISGPAAQAALGTELSVIRWSARNGTVLQDDPERLETAIRIILERTRVVWDEFLQNDATARTTWLTENRIREAIVDIFDSVQPGDRVDIALFYLSDRRVIDAMKRAIRTGARLRLILDANRDAFGREKNGIPNRPVAAELMGLAADHDVDIRWADTKGEQFHPKAMAVIPSGDRPGLILAGSANWTRRNLGGLNLEADLLIENPGPALEEFETWFNACWENEGAETTLDYEVWAISGWTRFWKNALYRFQEASGAGTF